MPVCWLGTPVVAFSVFGVIVGAAPTLEPWFHSARKVAASGEGGGKATGPPIKGAGPVNGVSPERKESEGSNAKSGGWTAEPLVIGPVVSLRTESESSSKFELSLLSDSAYSLTRRE